MLGALFAVSPEWSAHFLLVLARISAALVVMPMFGAKGVPAQAKIGLAMLLSLVVLPLHARPAAGVPTQLLGFAAVVGSEVLLGICVGVLVALVINALAMGATIVGVQMGFGQAELLDPFTGAQTEMMSQFYWLLVTLVFFAINGHHLVILGLVQTFQIVPAGSADISLIASDRFVPFVSVLFGFALRVGLPIMGSLLLTDIALGLVARTVPQMNMLVEGFPVKITIGMLVLAASIPLLTGFLAASMTSTLPQINRFLVAP